MMTASQFYVMARRLEDAYAAQMRSLCKETGVAQTAMDILLFLHNNPGYDTARDICTYRQLKPALVSLLHRESGAARLSGARGRAGGSAQMPAGADGGGRARGGKGLARQAAFTARMLEGLSPEELAAGQHCLSVITENIRNITRKDLFDMQTRDQAFWARSRSAGC